MVVDYWLLVVGLLVFHVSYWEGSFKGFGFENLSFEY